jgi:hypothetical protein
MHIASRLLEDFSKLPFLSLSPLPSDRGSAARIGVVARH